MQTTLHRYCFDIREPAGEAAWRKLKARLTAGHPRRFGPVLAEFRWPYDIKCTDGRTLPGEG